MSDESNILTLISSLITHHSSLMLIIPAIDLKDGKCVRLTQGRRDAAKFYDGEPVEIARAYERAGAAMLHVVDLDGAFRDRNARNREVAREIFGAVGIPVQFGGGVRAAEDVEELIGAGASRVVIGTLAVEAPDVLAGLAGRFGEKICVGIDARDGQVLTRGWEKQGGVSAIDLARRVAEAGVSRVVYTDVSRDGTLAGVNIEQTRAVARETGLLVTASGGVASLVDLERLRAASDCGIDSVIVGKALYEGRFTLEEALRFA